MQLINPICPIFECEIHIERAVGRILEAIASGATDHPLLTPTTYPLFLALLEECVEDVNELMQEIERRKAMRTYLMYFFEALVERYNGMLADLAQIRVHLQEAPLYIE